MRTRARTVIGDGFCFKPGELQWRTESNDTRSEAKYWPDAVAARLGGGIFGAGRETKGEEDVRCVGVR